MPATQEKRTILVVDDEEFVRVLLSQILGNAGFNVILAPDGYQALDTLKQETIDLVLLDIHMPGMNGFQTLESIRLESDIPVIMVTGLVEVTSVSSGLSLGADDYITKPFRPRELLARVQAKLRRATN